MRSRTLLISAVALLTLLVGTPSLRAASAEQVLKEAVAEAATNPAAAFAKILPIAETGDPQAQHYVAKMLAAGQGVPRDPAEALRWWHLAAEQGHQEAQFHLGLAYASGLVPPADKVEALKWMIIARVRDGMSYSLLIKLMDQNSIETAERRADEWTRSNQRKRLDAAMALEDDSEKVRQIAALADEGMASAQFELGELYRRGVPDAVPGSFGATTRRPDLKKAVALFRVAAERGLSRAQTALGLALLDGEGVDKDPVAARQWFTRAADKGNADAQFYLAAMFEAGVGGPEDLVEARRLYLAVAQQGDVDAMSALGLFLSVHGKSGREREAAYMWLLLASRSYRDEGMPSFAEEIDQQRRGVSELMTQQQIDRATAAAATCLDTSYSDCG